MTAATPNTGALDWRDRPYQPLRTAAEIVGCSRPHIYKLAAQRRLELVRVAGMPMVPTDSILALLQSAEPWTPDTKRNAAAVAARKRREHWSAANG